MLSILQFSGKHWARAALIWGLLALAIDGMAKVEAQAPGEAVLPHSSRVADGVLQAAKRVQVTGTQQVARTTLTVLDLGALDAAAFGDAEEPTPAR